MVAQSGGTEAQESVEKTRSDARSFRPSLSRIASGTILHDEAAVPDDESSDGSTVAGSSSEAQVFDGPCDRSPGGGIDDLSVPLLLGSCSVGGARASMPSRRRSWERSSFLNAGIQDMVASPQHSVASSGWMFAEPTQALVFLDWDDTLFPTTDLFERWGLPRRPPKGVREEDAYQEELRREMKKWQSAVQEYLEMACLLTDRCVIVTNSVRPWVETCVERFAPNLLPLFNGTLKGPRVVYAGESLQQARAAKAPSSCCCPIWWQTVVTALKPMASLEERRQELTEAKLAAMRREAIGFYSRYPGQTWKNIISLGDMKYERDAVVELSAARATSSTSRERLRTKAFVLPSAPSISELTVWLRIFKLLLPALVRYDGDIDADLYDAEDPMHVIGQALNLPELGHIVVPQADASVSLPDDAPGVYRLVYDAPLKAVPQKSAPGIGRLEAGSFVEVLEICTSVEQRCVMGRVESPAGWLTLVSAKTGVRWAEKEDEASVEAALDEIAVAVQDSYAAPALLHM